MFKKIKTVAILGANGLMGSLTGGLIAQSGYKVYFLSRSIEKSNLGLQRAIKQARSEIIRQNIICNDYNQLQNILKDVDWIIECISENLEIKKQIYEKIDRYKSPGTIISSMTSSLSLTCLCSDHSKEFKKNFLGVHLFNPPTKLLLCEIASQKETDPNLFAYMSFFLKDKLRRVVVPVNNIPAYAGNRIGFLLFCEITRLAKETGIEMMDYLIGPYTGRSMSPFSTIDLIGLDTYKAIIESLYTHTNDFMHESFHVQDYIKKMIEYCHLGNKTPDRGGFYRKDIHKNKYIFNIDTFDYKKTSRLHLDFVEKAKYNIHIGLYREAFNYIKNYDSQEADIVRRVLCSYIAYSFSCIGEVTNATYGINLIDKIMVYGFNWAPPSVILSLLGGFPEIIDLLQRYNISIPEQLNNADTKKIFSFNYGKYFIAR